ncbi:MAG: flagellar export chaperone FlgN, partial [Lachnospiraceae bacterium]|nr:flagellar export chaperone FlgN [Lachnospiraceae bacterium]
MASIIENLVLVLERENTEYEQLLGLSMRKTSIIVAGKPQELEQITDEEQIIVNRVQKLEKDRQQAMDEIARVINRDVTTIRLPDVIRILER